MPVPPQTPAERFASTLAAMRAAVAARQIRPGKGGLPGWLVLLIWTRLGRIAKRVARIFAHLEAGTLKPPRRRPAAARRTAAKLPPGGEKRLPRAFCWLPALVPGISFGGSQLAALLEDPEMQAMLTAAPQIARHMRPIFHMLGVRPLPPLLRLPPRSQPAPSDPATGPATGPATDPPAPAKRNRKPPPDPSRPPRNSRKPRINLAALEVAPALVCPPTLAWVFGR